MQHAVSITRGHRRSLAKSPRLKSLMSFGQKVTNDGVLQLAGTLAYSLLLAVAPLLVGLLGIIGVLFFVSGHSSADLTRIIVARVGAALPTSGLQSFAESAQKNSATLGVIGLVSSIIAGAGFFLNVDYTFSIILRLKQRTFLRNWLMAIGMVFLLIPLILIIVLATSIPQALVALTSSASANPALSPLSGFISWIIAFASGVLAAFLLFSAIYFIVPNQRVKWRDVFAGALLAAVLLEAYTLLFPFYASHFLKPSNYGASMGFALVVLVFFYYFAVILLLGVEFNSWLLGRRDLSGTLPEILHKIDDHGAAIKPDTVIPPTSPEQRLGAKSPEKREDRPPDQDQRGQGGSSSSRRRSAPASPRPPEAGRRTEDPGQLDTVRASVSPMLIQRWGSQIAGAALLIAGIAFVALLRSRFLHGLHFDIDLS